MGNLSGWDVAILGVAAYVAIVTLVRLMRQRRDEEVARLQVRVAHAQRRKRADAEQKRQQRVKEQAVNAQGGPKKAGK